MSLRSIQVIGRIGIAFFQDAGRAGIFLFQALVNKPEWKAGSARLIQQLHVIGMLSLVVIVLSAAFIGMVLALQGYP